LISLVPKQEINDEWEQIKTAIVDAARDVIQIQGTPPKNEWWDEEYKKIIQEKIVTTEDKNKLEHIY